MGVVMRLLTLMFILIYSSCNPFIIFSPKKLKTQIHKNDNTIIAIDNYGIPFIKGSSLEEVFYALGFMHARDRLFQLDLIRHVALGRTTEFFNDKGLAYDRKLRVLTYKLEDQLKELSAREHNLLDHYVNGVNDGAKKRGKTAEHFLLGIDFAPFSKLDIIAIARLQTWYLAADLLAEITRLEIAASNWSIKAKEELFLPPNDQGSAIIYKDPSKTILKPWPMPQYLNNMKINNKAISLNSEASLGEGASNAWAIMAHKTKENHAILMNDPHLLHTWPSNFYLATLSAPDYHVFGASFVGLPGILIGATPYISYGDTASYLNTQDSVLLHSEDKLSYIVDGEKLLLEEWPQQYCFRNKSCISEMNYISIFGPVIDNKFDPLLKENLLAVQWTGFKVKEHQEITYGFIELAQAKNVQEAMRIANNITMPGVNIILADIDGNIGYTYAGKIPIRDPSQHPYLPLDGSTKKSLWSGFINDKPQSYNPKDGFIINANQNIFSHDSDIIYDYGRQGAPPYRAMRIKEKILSLAKNDQLNLANLSSIQLDNVSIEAKQLAPLLGDICQKHFPLKEKNKQIFAQEIMNFDGSYHIDSLGALPYEALIKEILHLKLADVLDKNMPDNISYFGRINYNIKQALYKELLGHHTDIFLDERSHDINKFIGLACDHAYDNLVKQRGRASFKWRYGRHHYLFRQSVLAKAPFLGVFFADKKRPIGGAANAPMAETGLPVLHGASMRFQVKMSNPPEIYAVIDSGNSGNVGDHHNFDQADLWHDGKLINITQDLATIMKNAQTIFYLSK